MTDQKEVMRVVIVCNGDDQGDVFYNYTLQNQQCLSEGITDRCLHTALLDKRHNEGITAEQANDFVQHQVWSCAH